METCLWTCGRAPQIMSSTYMRAMERTTIGASTRRTWKLHGSNQVETLLQPGVLSYYKPNCYSKMVLLASLPVGSPAHAKYKAIVAAPLLLKDVRQLSPSTQTYGLESFHSVLNGFASKSMAFSPEGMYERYDRYDCTPPTLTIVSSALWFQKPHCHKPSFVIAVHCNVCSYFHEST